MNFIHLKSGFELRSGDNCIIRHSSANPCLYVGKGNESVDMYRGNFKIDDYIEKRVPLALNNVRQINDGWRLDFGKLSVDISVNEGMAVLKINNADDSINRFWLRLCSDTEEKVYGCGEQMSYFNLRGKHFPLWVSEPGVGRNKSTYLTWRCDSESKSGGDYYTTNYAQPTFVSSRKYFLHADSTAYADFDFRNSEFHELQFWEVPKTIYLGDADTFPGVIEKLTALLGRQPELPEWVYSGIVIGVQGGTERSFSILKKSVAKGIPVAGVWCQDWEGKKETSFGSRLRWNWQWDKNFYPDLPLKIKELHAHGIKFLGYINPYLLKDTPLFREAENSGYFAITENGSTYLVDFGEFDCGIVDFTNPDAFEWYKNVIKENLISFGLDGWMADFGEYLPSDCILFNGRKAMIEHNRWPVLWAKCNYDAVKETGNLGKIMYFMRSGGVGSAKYCTMLWAGDQSVDFTPDDGLPSVICGALSSGMSGCGLTHSDIGGYTSLYGNIRTKELFLRWSEMAAFTLFMRTHEGNRPKDNFQYYDDDDAMVRLASLTKIHTALAPYLKSLATENAKNGMPVQRPLFFYYDSDPKTYNIQNEYLLGRDMLVAPVCKAGVDEWQVYLPNDEWVNLWTGSVFHGGVVKVSAPLGRPPVFFLKNSKFSNLFQKLKEIK